MTVPWEATKMATQQGIKQMVDAESFILDLASPPLLIISSMPVSVGGDLYLLDQYI